MTGKRWSEYPEAMARKVAMGKALAAAGEAPKRKRGKRARSPLPRPQTPPTARLLEALEAVHVLTEALEGQAPSATQLGERLGISRLGARKLLLRLAARGLVADVPKVVSSGQWAVTPDGDRALALKE